MKSFILKFYCCGQLTHTSKALMVSWLFGFRSTWNKAQQFSEGFLSFYKYFFHIVRGLNHLHNCFFNHASNYSFTEERSKIKKTYPSYTFLVLIHIQTLPWDRFVLNSHTGGVDPCGSHLSHCSYQNRTDARGVGIQSACGQCPRSVCSHPSSLLLNVVFTFLSLFLLWVTLYFILDFAFTSRTALF